MEQAVTPQPSASEWLSPHSQERIIYLLFVEGLSTDAIARRFQITQRHVRRIRAVHMAKMVSDAGK
jgi:DNA-binding CsgD family transcriptional regulator